MMSSLKTDLPFQPIRSSLYHSFELMAGYDPGDPQSAAATPDFQTYRYFKMNGSSAPADPYAGMMEALHDNSIVGAMSRFLAASGKPAVAIMGGHNERRDTKNFAQVAS